jgi:hypothetical protein
MLPRYLSKYFFGSQLKKFHGFAFFETVSRPDPVICLLTASGSIDIAARYRLYDTISRFNPSRNIGC